MTSNRRKMSKKRSSETESYRGGDAKRSKFQRSDEPSVTMNPSAKMAKRIVGKELSRFRQFESDPKTMNVLEAVCREFVTNVLVSPNGAFGDDFSIKTQRSNPKNEDMRQELKILEEQLESYLKEEKAWDMLSERVKKMTEAYADDNVDKPDEEVNKILDDLRSKEDINVTLKSAQTALMKADDMQRALSTAEQVSANALEAKARLAKSFDMQMRSTLALGDTGSTMPSKTPRKLIKGLLR